MHTFSRSVKTFGIVMSLLIAMPLFAESAPVYDADNMPQQFDDSAADQQDVPPPAPDDQSAQPSMSTDQRLRRVEQQVANMQSSDSSQKISALQDQVQTLRGQVEQLTHDLQQAQAQQKSQYTDLDKRLSQQASAPKISKPVKPVAAGIADDSGDTLAAAPKTVPVKATPTDQPNVAEEQQIYQTAYNLIKAKKYDQAVTALQGMLQKYPSGQFASNAHYWLGELYGLMGKNDQALSEFGTVVKNYPDSPRLSDAQLKLGLIYAAESKWIDAKTAFKKVVSRYPGSAPARLASEQLKQIKQAGH